MAASPGWHPDENDPTITRYWDGTRWTAERSWNGTEWVDRGTPAPPPPATQPIPTAPTAPASPAAPNQFADVMSKAQMPLPTQMPRSATFWWLVAGAAAVAIAGFLPWAHASVSGFGASATIASDTPDGAPVIYVPLAALLIWLAWPATVGKLSKGRCIGLTAVGLFLSTFAFTNLSDLADAQDKAKQLGGAVKFSGGTGLYLYTLGVIAIGVGVVLAWLGRRNQPAAA